MSVLSIVRLSAIALLAALGHAQGDALCTVCSRDGLLRQVDPFTATTLAATPITTSNGRNATACNGLARDPVTGTLFALVREAGSPARNLATIAPATAFATIIGPLPDNFASLAFRADGTLFGVTGDGAAAPETLFTIDPATAQATLVRALGNGSDGEALGFAFDGFLYHASGLGLPNVDEVFERIDPAGNSVTTVQLSGHDYDEIMALCAYAGGNLMATDLHDDLLVITNQGHATRIGTLDHGPVKGMAWMRGPDTQAFFRPYGRGCPTSAGTIPLLGASGAPTRGGVAQFRLQLAPPVSFGTFVLGDGTGTIPVPSANCPAQIAPIGTGALFFVTSPAGAVTVPLALPTGLPLADYYLQTGIVDGNRFRVSNPLQMHVR